MPNAMYESELLCWGASSLPAFFCGLLYKKENPENLHKILPFFIVPLTIIISYVSFTTDSRTSADRILDEATGMNYQSIAYYMAQLFGLTIFCIISGKNKKEIKTNLVLSALLILQFITCVFSGGRGGLLLLLLYFIFFVYKKIKSQKVNIISILGLILLLMILLFLVFKFNILNTTGFSRLVDTFQQGDSNRAILQTKALESFSESPIWGHGIGSIFFEIGTYSHNILIDIMVETGIIGLISIVLFVIKCSSILIKKNDYNSLFITIIFIYALTLNTFSGYWLANHLLWFVFGYIISCRGDLNFSRVN
ncbi:MAG TPA: O-antigen ligase family protein [Candidatus Coprenecus pullistercoris]|nr:O-antigen ligase family protein [Candidatus Coprenecus pullistercoris]